MPDDGSTFRVGVTRDVRRPDGTFAFTPYDLSSLEVDGVTWSFLAEDARPLRPDLLQDLDGLYHFAVPVTAESLEGVERLAVLARQGVGLDFVDLPACTARGIAVAITPGAITHPMASAAATLVLALAHRLRERDHALHDGGWDARRFAPTGMGLTGRVLGVIGYGRIGRELVRLLTPWRMRVLVTQRTPLQEDGIEYVSLDALLEESDVVVVACPLTPETHGLLDETRLALMKSTAVLVNVARGAVVDEDALVDALRAGRLAGAGLDVFTREPSTADNPLLALPNVVGAPHSLGYTDELLRECVRAACDALLAVAAGRVPADVANPDVLENHHFQDKLARLVDRQPPR